MIEGTIKIYLWKQDFRQNYFISHETRKTRKKNPENWPISLELINFFSIDQFL